MKILVINSDLMVRVRILLVLENEEDVVMTKPDANRGFALCEHWKPDKIIYDLKAAKEFALKRNAS